MWGGAKASTTQPQFRPTYRQPTAAAASSNRSNPKRGGNKGGGGGGAGRGKAAPSSSATSEVEGKVRKDYSYVAATSASSQTQEQQQQQQQTGPTIYTATYAGAQDIQDFIRLLKEGNIGCLVDARIRPFCGYNKDFSQSGLADHLPRQGIQYEHYQELGNVFKDLEEEALFPEGPEHPVPYVVLLQQGGEVLTRRLRDKVVKMMMTTTTSSSQAGGGGGSGGGVAILCACSDHRFCHRNAIAGYLAHEHGFQVTHLTYS
ncbi:hypothetical protein QOT17_020706 [Balamuthia mandrillaris]